ncbi:MAG TPA: hypothetical protein ENI42_02300 [Thermoplasmatales archaeon]|nr:hypothetical protein [Thermoplasmatales archaeon]
MGRRTRWTPPLKRKYFHTQPKISKKDTATLKTKIELLRQKKIKEELENRRKKRLRRLRRRF